MGMFFDVVRNLLQNNLFDCEVVLSFHPVGFWLCMKKDVKNIKNIDLNVVLSEKYRTIIVAVRISGFSRQVSP
ncbi:hypothetical protein LZ24_01062 [Desulfobotulus alkaliphilus]|uniref:Uncharacterized protein n=1 Tax=Desulfobotulus alkaliphilus TaxID=622671 RepID=A0A562RYI3_9BACT|nr:hypothetical protein LZ24_01062 [Desulfobotulus alkaliphilus]